MRVLTMTDENYEKVERALKHGLGHDIGLGWSGRQFDEALAIVQGAEETPKEPCGYYECEAAAAAEDEYCPAHKDVVERIEAMQAAG